SVVFGIMRSDRCWRPVPRERVAVTNRRHCTGKRPITATPLSRDARVVVNRGEGKLDLGNSELHGLRVGGNLRAPSSRCSAMGFDTPTRLREQQDRLQRLEALVVLELFAAVVGRR